MDGYLGEIRMVSFDRPVQGWARCEGQLLPIHQHQALYAILGPRYGGNGATTFGLPDLRGRVPAGFGSQVGSMGSRGGLRQVTLTAAEMPHHTHGGAPQGVLARGLSPDPTGNLPAVTVSEAYGREATLNLAQNAVSTVGGSQPHSNVQPSLGVHFIICLQGVFPTRN